LDIYGTLKTIKKADAAISAYQEALNSLAFVSAVPLDAPRSGNSSHSSPTEKAAVKIYEIRQAIGEALQKKEMAVQSALLAISRINSPTHEALLICRYIQGMSWQETACAIGYSEPYARKKLNSDAIAMLQAAGDA